MGLSASADASASTLALVLAVAHAPASHHVAELKKPRLSLGSTLGICLGAAGAGFLAGVVSQ